MKKADAAKAIRLLVHEWAKEVGFKTDDRSVENEPSFYAFQTWLQQNNYGRYLKFRSTAGALYDAEMWFDKELKQAWRR